MNLSAPFIARPVATMLLSLAILLLGESASACYRRRRCRTWIFR